MEEHKRFCLLSDGQIMDTRTRECDIFGDTYIETMMVGNSVYFYKKTIVKQADTIEELKGEQK